jgi:hypothetical protein
MNNLTTQIIAGVVATVIAAILLSIFQLNGQTHKVITIQGKKASKGWKIVIVIAWLMIVSGFYLFLVNYINGGFENVYVGMGFSSFFFGLVLLAIGKFGRWWSN